MARINIDDKIHRDHRFIKLMGIFNGDYYKALGLCIGAWTMAQDYFNNQHTDGLIPLEEWEEAPFGPILDSRLAEKTESGVYVKGSKDRFEWLRQKAEAGKKSGEVRKAKANGSRTKKNTRSTKNNDRSTAGNESEPLTPTQSHTQPTFSDSDSSSNILPMLDLRNAKEMSGQEIQEILSKLNITLTPDEVIQLYNKELANTGDLKYCRGLGTTHIKEMLVTFTKFPKIDSWQELFNEVKKAKKTTGEEPGGVFLATLDWLAVKDNALKMISGKYRSQNKYQPGDLDLSLSETEIEELQASGEIP